MQVAQAQPTRQMQMPMLGEVARPKKVEEALLRTCSGLLDAILLCVHLSRHKHYVIAEKLGIDRGHWTRIMQAQAHFPTDKLTGLMEICGNYAPIQYLAQSTGFELFEDAKSKRRDELRRELERLDAAA